MEETVTVNGNSSVGQGQLHSGHSHRRQRFLRLGGCKFKGVFCSGNLVKPRVAVAHQSPGDGGCGKISQRINVGGRLCQSRCGQQDYCCFYQQTGRYQIKGTVQQGQAAVEPRVESGGLDESSLDPKRRERVGGHVEQNQHHGVGAAPVFQDGRHAMEEVVHASSGSFCKQAVSSSAQLLQFPARQLGSDKGLLQHVPLAKHVLCFSSSTSDQHDSGQAPEGQCGDSHLGSAPVASIALVDEAPANVAGTASATSSVQHNPDVSSWTQDSLSESSRSMPGIRQNQLLSKDAEELLQLDIRSGTHKIYKSRFEKFRLYCRDLDTDPHTCPEEIIVNFLTILTRIYKYSYSTINGYRSAISRYHTGFGNESAGCARAVRRVTKAVFNVNPPLPRYTAVWNVESLVSHLETMHPPDSLSLLDLGVKTMTLISLSSLSRSSTVKLISPDYRVQGDTIIFSLTGLEKTARPGHVRGVLEISSSLFGSDKASLNTLQYLQHYLRETESHRAYFDAAENCRPSGLFVANTKASCSNNECFLVILVLSALPVCASLYFGKVDDESYVCCWD